MRNWFSVCVIAAFFTGEAKAQPPTEIYPPQSMEIASGETRTFAYDDAIRSFSLSVSGIVEIVPKTDHIFTVKALGPGRTEMTVVGADGKVTHRVPIVVAPSPAHTVRIYGRTESKKDGQRSDMNDYIGYQCTDISCSRADTDR